MLAWRSAGDEHTDARNLSGLLSLGGERRDEEYGCGAS
jgi:hypothetical protein